MSVGLNTGRLIVGYQNLFEFASSTVSASSEDSSHPKENLLNRVRLNRWKSGNTDTTHWAKVDLGTTAFSSVSQAAYTNPGNWTENILSGGAFPPGRIQPNSLTLSFPGPVAVTDNGSGGLTGAGVNAASTVDYLTGAVSLVWDTPPASGAVTASWTHDNGVSPDYLGITDLKVDDARDVSVGVAVSSSWDDSTWDTVSFTLNPWPVLFHAWDSGLDLGRYYRVEFGPVTAGVTVSASTIFLGRRYTFPEPMEAGFTPIDVRTRAVKAQAAGGVDMGTVLTGVKRNFVAKFGPAGIDSTEFDDSGGGSSQGGRGVAAKGWSAAPSLGRWWRSYYCADRAHFVFHDGEDGAYEQLYGKGNGRLRSSYSIPQRQNLRIGWRVDPDKVVEVDS